MRTYLVRVLATACVLLSPLAVGGASAAGSPAKSAAAPRTLGVNRSGTEYQCVHGYGIFDGPTDEASIQAMASWDINTVRVPLNEDCWLAINGVLPQYAGTNYQAAIVAYVAALNKAGLTAILDLHWSAPGTQKAEGQQVMADEDHSPAFWMSVAAKFAKNKKVAFDLYNEPNVTSWVCWLDGCQVSDSTNGTWQTAGMQELVNDVRSKAKTQQIIATGLADGNDLSGWLTNEPSDPDHHLDAGFHVYNFNNCVTTTCWDQTVAPVQAKVPVVTGEMGENDCATGFINQYMAWADSHNIGYLGWSWNPAQCGAGPALINSYDGYPTAFGTGLRDHLLALAGQPLPTLRVSFEDGGLDGWAKEYSNNNVDVPLANTSLLASDGYNSLAIGVTHDYRAIATASGLSGLATGMPVQFHVYVPGGAAELAITPFVEDSAYTVVKAPEDDIYNAGWQTVSFAVPQVDTVNKLGFQIDEPNGGTWSGQIALDEVRF